MPSTKCFVTPRLASITSDGKQILPLPAPLLARSVKKLRNQNRPFDYAEDLLGKRMDEIQRRVLNQEHSRPYRAKKRKRQAKSLSLEAPRR